MQDPALDLFAFPSVALKKPFDQPPDFSPNHLGNLFVQNNVEAGVAEVESHGEKRIGKGVSLRDQNFRSWRRIPANNRGGGAVAKQNRRNQVRLRNVFALKREGRQ